MNYILNPKQTLLFNFKYQNKMAITYVVGEKVNPQDLQAPRKWYGSAIHTETIKFKQLAREVAAESTTASEGDTHAVMIGMVEKIRYHLGKSHKIVIDGLGTFYVNISTDGAETEEKFTQSLIRGCKIIYQPDADMKDFLSTMKYQKKAKNS